MAKLPLSKFNSEPSLSDRLQEVLDYCQGTFEYQRDDDRFGRREHWAMPEESKEGGVVLGDCDDFALYVRSELDKRGIPSRLVMCLTETGGGHLVCEVQGYILDNRRPWVMLKQDMPYKWLKISGYESGDPWHAVS